MLEPEIHRPELDRLQEHGLHKVEEQWQRDGDDAAGEDGRDIGPFPLAGDEANTLHPPDPPIAGGFVGGGGADGSSEGSDFLSGFVSVAVGGFIFGRSGSSALPKPGPVTQPGRESANAHSRMKAASRNLYIPLVLSQRVEMIRHLGAGVHMASKRQGIT